MKQVTIVGLGMIGASLGLALKQIKPPPRVIGNDVQYDAARRAAGLKAVDRVERDLATAVAGSDLVVIATPIGAIPEVLKAMAGALADGCVVTDTGGTKREIVRHAQEILPATVGFVGGHPMTGPATAGVEKPDASLFHGAVYCLTPLPSAPPSAIAEVAAMTRQIGARPYFLDPAEHDGLVAGISHLPYVVGSILMKVLSSEAGWREMSSLAAGGFDAATRAAAHDPRMFSDVLATNADNVARHLDRLVTELSVAKDRLLSGDGILLADLKEAHRRRQEWEDQRRRAKAEG